jgi:hypothetical protein
MFKRIRASTLASAVAVASLLCPTARADDDSPSADRVSTAAGAAKLPTDRTWLYADDARVAGVMTVVGTSSLSLTDPGSSPSRIDAPYRSLAANTAQPGGMLAAGAEVGLLPRVSIAATGQVGFGGLGPTPSAGALAGMRFQLLPPSWDRAHLVASVGYVREAWQGPVYNDAAGKWLPGSPGGANGAWLQVAFSGDVQRLKLAATVHGEHVFADARDGLDLMLELGASYRVAGALRVGVEYVGQDLEEAVTTAAEGGARHFVGPVGSLQLLGDRLTIVAGPAAGLSSTSPRWLGRLAVAYGF